MDIHIWDHFNFSWSVIHLNETVIINLFLRLAFITKANATEYQKYHQKKWNTKLEGYKAIFDIPDGIWNWAIAVTWL